MAIDCHCHLNDEAFTNDYKDIVGRLSADNVNYAIIAGYNYASSVKALEIAELSPITYAAIGFHPENINEIADGDLDNLKKLYSKDKVIAVGEIGLDYHYKPYDSVGQKALFNYELDVAKELGLPVIIHQRDCGSDILDILKSRKNSLNGVMLHCFSESLEMCKEFVKLDCYISLGGTVTFKNARNLLDVAKYVPDELLLTETDSPYLSPEPNRGKRNEPKNVNFVVEKLANLRNIEKEQLEIKVEQNFKRLFKKVK